MDDRVAFVAGRQGWPRSPDRGPLAHPWDDAAHIRVNRGHSILTIHHEARSVPFDRTLA